MPNEKKGDEEHGVRLSYKFRIYPTPSQCEAIKANIDASRFVYNHYLRARMDAYERTQQEVRRPKPACDEQGNVQYDQDGKEIWERTEGGKVVFHTVPYDPAAKAMSMFDTSKDLTRLKKELVDEDGKPWLKEADATALIYALRNLDTAYQNFFRGIKKGQDVGFPKFKSRKNPVQTYKSGNQEDPVVSSGASVQQTHQNQSRLTVLLCLPPSATGHSQRRPQRNLNVLGSAASSSFPFPQRSSLPFSRSRIRIAWRVAAVNVPFSMPCSRIVRQPYINERKRVDPRSPSASIASVSIGEQPFSELSERIT